MGGNNYTKNSSLGYQTRLGLDLAENPTIHNVADLGISHPIPGGIRMNTHSPSPEEFPRPITLAVQNLLPSQDYHNLLREPWGNTGKLKPPPNRG